jgi:GTP-binding protein
MFCDQVKLKILAGKGGNGSMSFLREKYLPYGGPDGGNGGKGGDVIFRVNSNKNTLIDLSGKNVLSAKNGESGKGRKKNGKTAEDLIIEVPLGTSIYDQKTKKLLFDFKELDQEVILAKGGRGGFGNAHFTSSIRKTPRFAELGEEGEEKDLFLELKLVGDFGIIGFPNAGKSSLINALTSTKIKTANYPFTTLIPNLGVLQYKDETAVLTDIPGLIEGAYQGKGLGHNFLRHISRNSALIHLIDINTKDIVSDYNKINKELKKFDEKLSQKKQILVINKYDYEDLELKQIITDQIYQNTDFKDEIFFVSAQNYLGLEKLKQIIISLKSKLNNLEKIEKFKTYKLKEEEPPRYFEIEKLKTSSSGKQKFLIKGKRINQIVVMTNFEQEEAVFRLWDIFFRWGVLKKLEKLGIKDDDKIVFEKSDHTLNYEEF